MKAWVRDDELAIVVRCHTRSECKRGGEHGDGSRSGREHLDGVLEINMWAGRSWFVPN